MIKQCSNKYGYGCKNKIEYTKDEELDSLFYRKGGFSMNICKECVCKHHAGLYKKGNYNYFKRNNRIIDANTYGTLNTNGGQSEYS